MNRLTVARVTVAFVALALVLLPGEIWSDPQSDFEQTGFDENLVYTTPMSRSAFDAFVVSQHGTWEACPCPPGSLVTLSGNGLADSPAESGAGAVELGGVQVFVQKAPAFLHRVTPSQIDFQLPRDLTGDVATIEVVRDGKPAGSDTVAVGRAPMASGASVTGAELRLESRNGAEPEAHLITTPLSFRASMTATIEDRTGSATPLRLKLWNPRNESSLEALFGMNGQAYVALNDGPGRVARRSAMIPYKTGTPYDITVEWERGKRAAISISGAGGRSMLDVGPAEAPALFDAYRPTLTAGAAARTGASAVSLTGYQLDLTPERFITLRVDDPYVPALVVLLTALGAVLLLASVTPARAARELRSVAARSVRGVRKNVREHPVATVALGIVFAGYAAVNAALFALGSHPFDMASQATWSYITTQYGLTDLYYVSQTATLADVWNGVPYHEAVFPYNVGMSYYFWLIGQTHLFLFGHASPDSMSMQITIKAFNLAFLLADVALVYAIVRHLKPESPRLPWVVSAIVLFNPAVMFDTAIWGETESVVLFPLLASLLAALRDRPGIAWPFLALAFLSKQTVLLPVLAIALFYLVRFDFRRNLEAFSGAMVAVLAMILPFTVNGYPPSIAIDPALAGIWAHGGSGAERAFQVVSYDSFNVWTLATFLADGATGLARFQAPDYAARVGSLSYHDLGLAALAASLATLGAVALVRRRFSGTDHGVIVAVAIVFALELFLPTQTLSRYYVFAVVFAGIGLAGPSRWLSGAAFVAFTITAFVGQYGSMALVLQDFPQHAEHLAPQNNAISRVMADLFTSNGFITIAVLVNAFAVLALSAAFWRSAGNARQAATLVEPVPAALRAPIPAPISALAAPGEM